MDIKILELIRARDIILGKWECPHCLNTPLTGLKDLPYCSFCNTQFTNSVFSLEGAYKRNLIALTKKTSRKTITKRLIQLLLDLSDYKCSYCQLCVKSNQYHIDHIVPIAAGGTNNLDNLTVSCANCNQIASSKVFTNFEHKQRYIIEKKRLL